MLIAHRITKFMATLFAAAILVIPASGKAAQEIRPEVVGQAGVNGWGMVVSASRRLVAMLDDNGAEVFDLSTGLLQRKVIADRVNVVAISDDDRYLAIGKKYGLEVIDLTTGERLISLDANVWGIRFSSDGHWLAALTATGVFQIPTTLRKTEPQFTLNASSVTQLGGRGVGIICVGQEVSLSNDGRHLVCNTFVNDAQRWALIDMSTGKTRIGQNEVFAAAVTPDGHSVLTIMDGGRRVRLYDVAEPGKVQEALLLPDPESQNVTGGAVQPIAFRGNNEAVVIDGHKLYRINLNPLRSTKIDSSLLQSYFGYQTPFGMDPSGRILLASRYEDIRNNRFISGMSPVFLLLDIDALDQPPFRAIYGTTNWSGMPHDGRFIAQPTPQGLLLAQRFRDRARVTNLTTGTVVYDYAGLRSIGEKLGVMAMVDPAGRKAYFGRDTGMQDEKAARKRLEKKPGDWASFEEMDVELKKIREHVLVDLTTGRQIPLPTEINSIDATFSSQGNYLLMLGKDDSSALVSTADGKVLHHWGESMPRAVERCNFSDDEKRLHCEGRVVSIPDGKLLLDATASNQNQNGDWLRWMERTAKMSPDGRWLAYYENEEHKAHVLSVQTGKEVMVVKVDYWYTGSFSWSPDSRLILPNKYENPNITIARFTEPNKVEMTTRQLGMCTKPILTGQGTIVCLNEDGMVGNLDAIQIYDETTGQLKRGFPETTPSDYVISRDGHQIFLRTGFAGNKGQTILDTQTGETIANISTGADDWVITLPEGYYTAPRGVNKLIAIRKGNHAYSFDEFDLTLNRPDLVRERLGAPKALVKALKRAQAKRVQRFGAIDEAMRPTVEIDSRSLPLLTNDAQIKVAFNAAAVNGAKLTRAQVYVNGVPTLGRDGVAVTPDANGNVSQQLPVELTPGSNRIQVSVFDDKGIESLRDTGVVARKAAPAPITRYLLAVGVSQYADSSLNLDYAAKDATDLAAALQRSSPGIERTVVKTLTDAEVTRDKLREARQFFADAKPQDQAIVFIAGHGLLDDKDDYYFAGYDVDAANPAAKGVPITDIEDLFADTKARARLLLMDSCHSGEVDHDMEQKLAALPQGVSGTRALKLKTSTPKPASGEPLDATQTIAYVTELFADLRRGVGATALASASGIELALESSQYKNGLFTSAMLEALNDRSTDTDNTRSIEMTELRDRVTARVRTLSNGTQTPSTRVENYDENLLMSAWAETKEEPVKAAAKGKGKKKK
ncbi:MAG: caspase family protein [Sideroxydans sp.]|nr:caspase family protein [Sideroxydans sp.]